MGIKPRPILVVPRWRVSEHDPDVRYAVISITDTRDPDAKIPKRWGLLGVLRLRFNDLMPPEDPWEDAPQGVVFMSDDDGLKVRQFIEQMKDAEMFIVHCEAAAGRSPSLSFAICDALGWGRGVLVAAGDIYRDAPNRHVYETTFKALK